MFNQKKYSKNYYLKNKERIKSKRLNRYYNSTLKQKESQKESQSKWWEKNREKYIEASRRRLQEIRLDVLKHYGGNPPKCECCNENTPQFLGIDHIDGGGGKHRKVNKISSIYRWLRKNNYPEGFQVLCHNCNLAKGFYGKCPHPHKV